MKDRLPFRPVSFCHSNNIRNRAYVKLVLALGVGELFDYLVAPVPDVHLGSANT